MTLKFILRGLIILIGISQLHSCTIFGFDSEDEFFLQDYQNLSSNDIEIIISNSEYSDTVSVSSNSTVTRQEFKTSKEEAIQEVVDGFARYNMVISLLDAGIEKKIWSGPSGSFGNSINSPFNYDSWLFESLTPDARNVVGKITFVVTDEDLEG